MEDYRLENCSQERTYIRRRFAVDSKGLVAEALLGTDRGCTVGQTVESFADSE